jgi:hypothetical protein
MFSARGLLAALLFLSISLPTALAVPAPELAPGVLTRASDAHLNALPAFPGLSVFEDENISTEVEGKLGVRIGNVMLALLGNTSATLHRINSGTHVDMESGWLYFSSPADSCVEIHAIDALLRPAKNQRTQARVRIDAPHELQVSAILGDLLFIYQDESRIIPEGKTYQINLNPEGATQMPAVPLAALHLPRHEPKSRFLLSLALRADLRPGAFIISSNPAMARKVQPSREE